jgi:hypothetical protein
MSPAPEEWKRSQRQRSHTSAGRATGRPARHARHSSAGAHSWPATHGRLREPGRPAMVVAVSGHRGFGGLLRQRSFRLLWSGETSSQLGNAMAGVAMPLLAVEVLHASNFAVASLTAAATLPWLVIGLFVGAWVDRLPARPVMIICDLVSLVLYASLPVAYWLGVLTFVQVLVVALLAGGCSVVFLTAYYVYLPALVSPADLIEGNAKLQAGGAATRIGGPGLGGLVSQAIGPAATLLFNAASFLISAACVSGIRAGAARRDRGGRTATIRQDIAQGIRFVATDRYLRRLAVFAAFYNLGLSGPDRGLPGPVGRPGLRRCRRDPRHRRDRRAARRASRGSSHAAVRHIMRPGPERRLHDAVHAADSPDRPGPQARVLRRRRGDARRRAHHRQHHYGQLRAGLLPPRDARPRHNQHADADLRHRGTGRPARRRPR